MRKSIPAVDDYMARDLITFAPGDDIHMAINSLLDAHIAGAPVIDARGRLVGVLSTRDCFGVVYSTSYHQEWGGRVADYMSTDVATIESGTNIFKAADMFMSSTFGRFPVVQNERIKGQISRTDLLRALQEHWESLRPARG